MIDDLAATVVETVTAPAAYAVVAVTAVVVVAVAAVGWLKKGRAWSPDGTQTKQSCVEGATAAVRRGRVGQPSQPCQAAAS